MIFEQNLREFNFVTIDMYCKLAHKYYILFIRFSVLRQILPFHSFHVIFSSTQRGKIGMIILLLLLYFAICERIDEK